MKNSSDQIYTFISYQLQNNENGYKYRKNKGSD